MSLLQFFKSNKSECSASVAKERLQILVAHERLNRSGHDFLPAMKQDILKVIEKYFQVADNTISVRLDNEGDCSTLEVNVQLPENS
ncbi:cell division topological specificity factor MinE [Endozoicomonas arenosclerae]|uniref:cell division topological specificity factor MinE n=1 Tax=Endozoicomonas arenosclerae TaxID=1633495 RepID=UPI000784B055|nr:cell division topological specificity factor MinE [Endozoicomonas arenosclerae]